MLSLYECVRVVWEHTKTQLCHRERFISVLALFPIFPVIIQSNESSTFTCHFWFPNWAEKQSRQGAAGLTGNNAHIQLSSLVLRTQAGQRVWKRVHVYDWTWWGWEVLFRTVTRLRTGNASDVALKAVSVLRFTTKAGRWRQLVDKNAQKTPKVQTFNNIATTFIVFNCSGHL